jgi:hypothetical protein
MASDLEDGTGLQPLDFSSCRHLLQPLPLTEEVIHPWHTQPAVSHRSREWVIPLMRVRDWLTDDEPDPETGIMRSRAHRATLRTAAERKNALTIHLNHANWTATPFLSFSSSPSAIWEIAEFRRQPERGRGAQTITVINPDARTHAGLPTISVAQAMKDYRVDFPAHYWKKTYDKDYHLCLWEVSREEIVGHYEWDTLRNNPDWYQEIILPAYQDHERRRIREHTRTVNVDLPAPNSSAHGLPAVRDTRGDVVEGDTLRALEGLAL